MDKDLKAVELKITELCDRNATRDFSEGEKERLKSLELEKKKLLD